MYCLCVNVHCTGGTGYNPIAVNKYINVNIILYSLLQRVTIPDAVIIQFFLLKMAMLMLETYPGL
jgi:hypothetical protein